MDFKQLEYFRTIYEEGSISKAAEKLFISQQGVSKAVSALEKELDCKLFDRTPKGILLTLAGEVLIKRAAKLLDDRDSMVKEMMEFRQHENLAIDLVIGSRFSLPERFFDKFLARYPSLNLNITELANEVCLFNLEHGRTDLAIVHACEQKEGLVIHPVKKEIMTIVVPEDHFLAEKKEISLSDLVDLPIVYHQGSSSRFLMEKCREQGVYFAKGIQVPGMLALYQTCANMRVPGLSLDSLKGKFKFDNLVSIPVRKEEATWDLELVYRESMSHGKIVKCFVDFLMESMQNR